MCCVRSSLENVSKSFQTIILRRTSNFVAEQHSQVATFNNVARLMKRTGQQQCLPKKL